MVAGLVFLFAPTSLTSELQFAFVRVFHRPLSIFRNFTLATYEQQSSTNVVDRSKYIRLRNHLANNIQWLRQERQKVEKLSGLRDGSVWKGVNFVLADVVTAFIYGSRNEFIINRGKDDGLAKGQFVLGNYSIIGTISDLDSHTARVLLITDPRSKTAVNIGELNVPGIMQGNGNCSAKIQMISVKHKIKIDEIVYVQKTPGFLKTPLIAGVVTRCKRADTNPLLWDVTVKPACDIQKLKSVTVILMNLSGLREKE